MQKLSVGPRGSHARALGARARGCEGRSKMRSQYTLRMLSVRSEGLLFAGSDLGSKVICESSWLGVNVSDLKRK